MYFWYLPLDIHKLFADSGKHNSETHKYPKKRENDIDNTKMKKPQNWSLKMAGKRENWKQNWLGQNLVALEMIAGSGKIRVPVIGATIRKQILLVLWRWERWRKEKDREVRWGRDQLLSLRRKPYQYQAFGKKSLQSQMLNSECVFRDGERWVLLSKWKVFFTENIFRSLKCGVESVSCLLHLIFIVLENNFHWLIFLALNKH